MELEETFVDECINIHGNFLVPILQDIQEKHNYLPEELLRILAEKLEIPLRDIYGVATFYRSFSLTPKGKHIITVCLGTACHVRGGARIVDTLSDELGIKSGETTKDLQFTLETVNCLGCCAIGPIVVVDGEYYGEMGTSEALKLVKSIEKGGKSGKNTVGQTT